MTSRPVYAGILAAALAAAAPARAQDAAELGNLVNKALIASNAERWQDSLDFLNTAIERFGKDQPLQRFGPQFGAVYFRKGMAEMKLRRWQDASRSFGTCYAEFPNTPAAGGNVFQIQALLKGAEASMGAEQWQAALDQFRKFINERDRERDNYSKGVYFISVAICHYKLRDVVSGNENLEIALRNKDAFPTPDGGIVAGFEALVGAAITTKNERALMDFIRKNRGELTFEPYIMQGYSPVYLKLATDAIAAGMPRVAIELYHFVPSTDTAIDDLRSRIAAMGTAETITDGARVLNKTALRESLAKLETEYRGPGAAEIVKLGAAAVIHEKCGNLRGAHAAYEQLALYFPDAAQRESHLFNYLRTGMLAGDDSPELASHASLLLEEFPKSPQVPTVRRMLLAAVLDSGKYEQCIAIAAPVIDKLEAGTAEHDLYFHALGASYYHTGAYGKARPILDQHVEKYPASQFTQASRYLQASTLAKLRLWAEATLSLEAFLKKYPDPAKNGYYSFALLDLAVCEQAAGQTEAASRRLARIEKEFPETAVLQNALNLRGRILRSLNRPDDAAKVLTRALEAAEARQDRAGAAEALSALIGLPGDGRHKQSAAYADRFWKEYSSGSPFQLQVAIAEIPAFKATGRTDEALERLQTSIVEASILPDSPGLEDAVGAYSRLFLESRGPDDLRASYDTFSIGQRAPELRAYFQRDLIEAYEKVTAAGPEGDAAVAAATARLQALYQDLRASFTPRELPDTVLLKLAEHLRSKTSTPRESLPYYGELVTRGNPGFRVPALFGRADILATSGDPAEATRAAADFETIFRESNDLVEREVALARFIRLRFSASDFQKSAEAADAYLAAEAGGFTRFRDEVSLVLANSRQELGRTEEAIPTYRRLWSERMDDLKISAPAMLGWMELVWQRNSNNDRKEAFEAGVKYLEFTGRLRSKLAEDELELWKQVEQLVARYKEDPAIRDAP